MFSLQLAFFSVDFINLGFIPIVAIVVHFNKVLLKGNLYT